MVIAAKRAKTIEARRQDLIQGTIRSIAARGYHNSTVQTICEAVGLSRGLIGHYFEGKDDLLLEAFRHLVATADEETRQAVRAAGEDPLKRLLAATAVTFSQTVNNYENAVVWLACCGVAPWNGKMMELHRKLYRRYRSWIEKMIQQAAVERGAEIDAKQAALTYVQMVDGFWMGWLMDRDAYTLDDANRAVGGWLLGIFGEQAIVKRKSARPRARPVSLPASE